MRTIPHETRIAKMQAEANPICDCGNPATMIRNREWICQRCKRIEDSMHHDVLKTLSEHNRAATEFGRTVQKYAGATYYWRGSSQPSTAYFYDGNFQVC